MPPQQIYTITKDTVLPITLVLVLLGGAWKASSWIQSITDQVEGIAIQLDHMRIQMEAHEATTLHKAEFARWADVARERYSNLPDPPQ